MAFDRYQAFLNINSNKLTILGLFSAAGFFIE